MKIKLVSIMAFTVIIATAFSSTAQKRVQKSKGPVIKFVKNEANNKVDVIIDGKLFTSYWWPDTVYKPILYPLLTAAGTPVTRGFPIKAREGERRDHIHQVGNWLNYGNVNGYDFWGNGSEGKRNVKAGEIKHISIEKLSGGTGEGSMITTAGWIAPDGKQLFAERTELHFIAKG